MSKYVKELMMDQLKSDLDGSWSVLIMDLKGLDAIAEHQLRRDLRKKSIQDPGAEELARPAGSSRRWGWRGYRSYSPGPSVAVWGGDGVAELAKEEMSRQVKALKTPEIKGGAVDGIVIGAEQVEEITKLPTCEELLIGRVASLAAFPRTAGRRAGQRTGRGPDEPVEDIGRGGSATGESEPEPDAGRRAQRGGRRARPSRKSFGGGPDACPRQRHDGSESKIDCI